MRSKGFTKSTVVYRRGKKVNNKVKICKLCRRDVSKKEFHNRSEACDLCHKESPDLIKFYGY